MHRKPSALIRFTTMQYQIRLVGHKTYSSNSLPDTVAK